MMTFSGLRSRSMMPCSFVFGKREARPLAKNLRGGLAFTIATSQDLIALMIDRWHVGVL